jgi:DNA-binding IscR family transcriptional regulator
VRRTGLLRSQRGPEGGYRLARSADTISIADVIRALDGELANVRGSRPENLAYIGSAAALQEVWIALRASERAILEGVTLAHVVSGDMPKPVAALVANPSCSETYVYGVPPGNVRRSPAPDQAPSVRLTTFPS